MSRFIKTRILVLSDTHGMDFDPDRTPLQNVDVAVHCGDLTDGSKLQEFRTTLQLLENIQAPLKLVIAGNHDFTMDREAFQNKVQEVYPPLEPELVAQEYGVPGEAEDMFQQANDRGVVFLKEGTHHFNLSNGASLTVYASPFTPALGAWGFQYHPDKGHEFNISPNTDLVITHGPAKGVMDYTYARERAGCPYLFEAVARARPLVHCFGHIHEGWGAKLVSWKPDHGQQLTHFTAIDNSNSRVIENLSTLQPSQHDSLEDIKVKSQRVEAYKYDRYCMTSHCSEKSSALKQGEQTLFINASIADRSGKLSQYPWLVEIDLSRS